MRVHCRKIAGVVAVLAVGLASCQSAPPPASPPFEADPKLHLSDVQLGPGDQIDVTIYQAPELSRTLRIPRSGIVFYPLVGEVDTTGLTANEFRSKLTTGLSRYRVDPQVNVEVTVVRSRVVVVLGEVNRPGVYRLDPLTDPLKAIALAGDFSLRANREGVILLRPKGEELTSRTLNLDDTLTGLDPEIFLPLEGGDVIYVPTTTIADAVRIAGIIEVLLRPILLTSQAVLMGFDLQAAVEGLRRISATAVILAD